MNTLIHLIILLCVVPAQGNAEPPEHQSSVKEILSNAIDREMSLTSGKAVFELTAGEAFSEDDYVSELMGEELSEGPLTIVYWWEQPEKVRVEIRRAGETIRTIVKNETYIRPGDGQLWEAEFLDGHVWHEGGPHERFSDQMWDLLWPLHWSISEHLTPVTSRWRFGLDLLETMYEIKRAKEQPTEGVRLEYVMDTMPEFAKARNFAKVQDCFVPITHEDIGMETHVGLETHYSEVALIDDVPVPLEMASTSSDGEYWRSRIIREETAFNIELDEDLFAIDPEAYDTLIKFPHGTSFMNFVMGIRDKVYDAWESITY